MIRKGIFNLLFKLGIGRLLFAVNRMRGKVPVLCFHRVHPDYDPLSEPIHPESFERLIKFLKLNYEIIGLSDLLDETIIVAKNACILTFDDATQDFEDYVLPILQKYQIKATLFVPTEAADSQTSIWNYKLYADCLSSTKPEVTIDHKGFHYHFRPHCLPEIVGLQLVLMQMDQYNRHGILREIEGLLEPGAEMVDFRSMGWKSLQKLVDEPLIQMECHTHGHIFLPAESPQVIKADLRQSIDAFQREFSHDPKWLAYPNGGYNDQVVGVINSYFAGAVTTSDRLADKHVKDPYCVPRFLIYYDEPYELFLRINGMQRIIQAIGCVIQFLKPKKTG